jgi:aspartyl/asparaginyl beta-hydroxylase (cupin superfamily)
MNKLIDSVLRYVPSEEWINQSSRLPWLKLNLDIPAETILKEANQVCSQSVLHRASDKFAHYSHQGWKSLTLYGDDATTTIQTRKIKTWTHIAELCPCTVEFVKKYWIIDDTTGRIRFMWLEPGGYILPHHDRNESMFYETNVAITQPTGCRFRFLDYGTVPFTTGSAFLVDISNKHFVANDSDQTRVHFIVHAKLKPGVIQSSYEQNFYN